MGFKENFGKNLRKYRKMQGFTQETLSEAIDTIPETVSRFESGKRFPTPDKLEKIVQVLNLSFDDLLKNDSDMSQEDELLKIVYADLQKLDSSDLRVVAALIRAYRDVKKGF